MSKISLTKDKIAANLGHMKIDGHPRVVGHPSSFVGIMKDKTGVGGARARRPGKAAQRREAH